MSRPPPLQISLTLGMTGARGLIDPARLREFFEAIEPQLYRYPAIDPTSFRAGVEDAVARMQRPGS